MDEKNLRTIQSLQRELQVVTPADPLVKEHIDRLNHQLNQYVSDPNTGSNDDQRLPVLQKALQDAIESFEGNHPDLTEALRVAINTLVGAGI